MNWKWIRKCKKLYNYFNFYIKEIYSLDIIKNFYKLDYYHLNYKIYN